ncbi:hypothetical protein [Streptomyces sp. NPDC048438]|uniref:acyl-CoA-like ligand-binding transcription factor n=1 Tax=Streptomyces sp. NPDC048438 TaxID=3365551 RepID=UPI003719ABFB
MPGREHAVASGCDVCVTRWDRPPPARRSGRPHTRFLERQEQWREDLAAELARREGCGAEAGLAAQLAAGTALVAFNTVLRSWCDGDGAEDPAALTDRVFAVIAPALDASGR